VKGKDKVSQLNLLAMDVSFCRLRQACFS